MYKRYSIAIKEGDGSEEHPFAGKLPPGTSDFVMVAENPAWTLIKQNVPPGTPFEGWPGAVCDYEQGQAEVQARELDEVEKQNISAWLDQNGFGALVGFFQASVTNRAELFGLVVAQVPGLDKITALQGFNLG